jgi:trehalose synthase-fused probable maltokinase
LTRRGFTHTPPLAGTLEYRRGSDEPWALAMLQGFVPNQGDAWQYILKRLGKFIEQVRHSPVPAETPPPDGATLLAASDEPVPPTIAQILTPHLNDAEQLGVRTAEMHVALAAATDGPALAPEPLTPDEQRTISQRALDMTHEAFELLRRERSKLAGAVADSADRVLALEHKANEQLARLADEPITVERIRCHGDYHLGQVLATGDDFVIIDFEGEPARPLAERREKQLAIRDVAGMIRSFHYASRAAVANAAPSPDPSERRATDAWAAAWYFWSAATFLRAYRRTAGDASFLPRSPEPFARVLEACLLEKAVYELAYELNNRPAWLYLPLAALVDLLG